MSSLLPPHLVVISVDITGVAIHAPGGDVPGYQVVFQVEDPKHPKNPIDSDPFFLTNKAMEDLIDTLRAHVLTKGHLSPAQQPSGPVQ